MSSIVKFITNSKGSGDWCFVVLDGEVIKSGHNLSFYDAFELVKYYGNLSEDISYHEITDEQLEYWEDYV